LSSRLSSRLSPRPSQPVTVIDAYWRPHAAKTGSVQPTREPETPRGSPAHRGIPNHGIDSTTVITAFPVFALTSQRLAAPPATAALIHGPPEPRRRHRAHRARTAARGGTSAAVPVGTSRPGRATAPGGYPPRTHRRPPPDLSSGPAAAGPARRALGADHDP